MLRASEASKEANRTGRFRGYLLALATTTSATALRYAMQQELADRNRLMLFIPAVLISAWYGGVGPGLFSLVLGALLCAWILIPPITNINFGDSAEQVGFVLYLLIGFGVIALVHRERQEKLKRESAQAELKELNHTLEERVIDRTRELELSNRELEGFCYSVSHDLRTPTRAIVGNIAVMMEDFGPSVEGPIRERLARISTAALKLSDLVDALLTYARLAKADLYFESVDLGDLITSEVRGLSSHPGQRIKVDMPDELIVTGDKAQLRTAIRALVSNAAMYAKDDGSASLSVTVETGSPDVILRFRDNGIGFDTRYLHKIFEPFERLHRDEEYPGVGMGLANVSRIAERHNGSVWAESTIGEGATIFLRLGNQTPSSMPDKQLVSA